MFDVSCGHCSVICCWRFTESGQLQGSFSCLCIPQLGKSRGGQRGHLSLSICCCLTHLPASASVSLLLSSRYPGRSIPLTPDLPGQRSPKHKGEIQTLWVLPHSILPAKDSVEGAAQLQAGVHLLIFLPRFYTNSSFLFLCTRKRLLPRPKQKDATAVCPAPAKGPSSPSLGTLRFWELPKPGNFKALQLWGKKNK